MAARVVLVVQVALAVKDRPESAPSWVAAYNRAAMVVLAAKVAVAASEAEAEAEAVGRPSEFWWGGQLRQT